MTPRESQNPNNPWPQQRHQTRPRAGFVVPGHQIEPWAAIRCGAGLPQCAGLADRLSACAACKRLALVELGRLVRLLVPVYLVELAGPDPAGLPAIRWPGGSSSSANRASRSSHGRRSGAGQGYPSGDGRSSA